MPVVLGDDGLFEVGPDRRVDALSGTPKPPVDKTFRVFDPGQGLLLPPSLDDWLPGEHLVRIRAAYTEGRGVAPYDPRLMVRLGRVALDGTNKAALEQRAAQAARANAEVKARERGDDEDTITDKGAAAAEQATPKPKAQRNCTDPDSKIMLTGDGAFHQCYTAQAVVDADDRTDSRQHRPRP